MKAHSLALINAISKCQKLAANSLMDSRVSIAGPIVGFRRRLEGWTVGIMQNGEAIAESSDKRLSKAALGCAKKVLVIAEERRLAYRPEFIELSELVKKVEAS